MKKEKAKANKSDMELLREIRDQISLEIQDMNFAQLKKYFESRLTLHPKSVWQKKKVKV